MVLDEFEPLLRALIEDLGYELWGCQYNARGPHALLRIYIDKVGGIQITDCEVVSKRVSALLDVEDPLPGNYHLEVSSPGTPRPLFYPKQYQRYIGEEVSIRLAQRIGNYRRLTGTLLGVNKDFLSLKVNEEEQLDIPFSNIVNAHLVAKKAMQ